jgi:amino acid transporter
LAIILVLFFLQSWIAADLAPAAHIHAADTAFYDIAAVAGGPWLRVLTSVSTSLAFGISCAIVCQSAIARILFAMARDRQIPTLLARIHPRTRQPYLANILVALVSLVLGLFFQDRIEDLALFQNFGALSAFCFVNLAVIGYFWVKQRERRVGSYLLMPLCGFAITVVLLGAMRSTTIILGCLWLLIGLVHLFVLRVVFERPVAMQA